MIKGVYDAYIDNKKFDKALMTVYSEDARLYGIAKNTDSQSSYLKYQMKLNMMLDITVRRHKSMLVREWKVNGDSMIQKCSKKKTLLVVLNNTSRLAHTTVLASCIDKLCKEFDLYIYVIFSGDDKQRRSLINYIGRNVRLIYSSAGVGLIELINLCMKLKPDIITWWAWPPGQWISEFLAGGINISVSFKYDFPAAGDFRYHLHSSGMIYGQKMICSRTMYKPFWIFFDNKRFSSDKKIKVVDKNSRMDAIRESINGRLVYAILAREEKVAQPEYLYSIGEILRSVKDSIYVWTGREERQDITNYFNEKGLQDRVVFGGFVDCDSYLSLVDIYLDSFPMGSGETFVRAGMKGIPIIAMSANDSKEGRLGLQVQHRSSRVLGCKSMLCNNTDEYIRWAVKMGKDREIRAQISNFVKDEFPHIFCGEDLKEYFVSLISETVSSKQDDRIYNYNKSIE